MYLVLAVVYVYISCDIYHSAGDVVGGSFGSDGVAAIVDSSSRVEIGRVRNSVIVEDIRFYGLFRVGEDYIFPCDSTLGVTVILDFSCGDEVAVRGLQLGVSYGLGEVRFGIENHCVSF